MASVNSWFHLPKILFFVIAIESVRYCTKMSTKRCERSEIAKLIVHSIFVLFIYTIFKEGGALGYSS